MSSSGTKRISVFSGLPQLASAALVPEIAVSLIKDRRSINASEMAREAIRRRLVLTMTRNAEAHVQIDVALCNRLLRDVAVAGRTLDLCANVRRVVELHVRLLRVTKHALPGEIDALFPHRGDLFDARPIGGDCVVADHARPDARQARDRTSRHALMAVLGAGDLLADVHVVRELDWLNRVGPAVHEFIQRRAKRRPRRREDGGTLPRQHRCRGRPRHVALVELTADTSGERQDADENDSSEKGTASHCPPGLLLGGARGSLWADTANVVHGLPDLRWRQRALHPLHLGHRRRRTVEDDGVDLAVARPMVPLCVRQIRWLGVLRRKRTVALATQPMAVPAVLRVYPLAGLDRRGIERDRVLQGRQLWIAAAFLRGNRH